MLRVQYCQSCIGCSWAMIAQWLCWKLSRHSGKFKRYKNAIIVLGCLDTFWELILFDPSTSNHLDSEAEQPSNQSLYKGIKTFVANSIVIADTQTLYHRSLILSSIRCKALAYYLHPLPSSWTRFSAPSQSRFKWTWIGQPNFLFSQFELDTLAGLSVANLP